MTTSPPERVPSLLIVDDHGGFRALAGRVLGAEGFDVVGEAGDLESGLRAARALRPDVVLLDVHLPDGDGLAATRAVASAAGGASVVLTSTSAREDVEPLLADSGASGFVPKHALSGRALRALLR